MDYTVHGVLRLRLRFVALEKKKKPCSFEGQKSETGLGAKIWTVEVLEKVKPWLTPCVWGTASPPCVPSHCSDLSL